MIPGDTKEFPWAAIERYSPMSGTMEDIMPGRVSLIDVAMKLSLRWNRTVFLVTKGRTKGTIS
jgi:hypothetical protein